MKKLFILLITQILISCDQDSYNLPPERLIAPPVLLPSLNIQGHAIDAELINSLIQLVTFDNGNCTNNVLAETRTIENGRYNLTTQIPYGFYCLKATQGSYIEEYSQKEVNLTTNQMLYSIINYQGGSLININITPLTHIESGLFSYYVKNPTRTFATSAINNTYALSLANSDIRGTFGFNSRTIKPKNINNGINSTSLLTDSHKYGFYLAAISYFTGQVSKQMDNGKIHESPVYTSIQYAQISYDDIVSDGKLDGLKKIDGYNIPLSFGSIILSSSIHRTTIAKAILAIANTTKNKTTLTPENLLNFAQSLSKSQSILFSELAPESADNTAPTITTNKKQYSLVNGTINFNPTITDPIGIQSVKYYFNLGDSDSASAYIPIDSSFYIPKGNDYSWNFHTANLGTGTYHMLIEAKDNVNNIATLAINFRVDKTPPTITTNKKRYLSLVNGTINFNPTITDPAGLNTVKYYLDNSNTPIHITEENNYSWNLDTTKLSDDEHQITIEAKDSLDNIATSTIKFHVDNKPPTITINKKPYSLVNGTINFNPTIVDPAGLNTVKYYLDNSNTPIHIAEENNYSWNLDWNLDTTTLSYGEHALIIKAKDSLDNLATSTINFHVDNTPPTITINKTPYSLVNGTINFNPTIADPAGLNTVKYYLDNSNTPIHIAEENNYSWNLDTTTLSYGEHEVIIEAKDSLNNLARSTININVDNTPSGIINGAAVDAELINSLIQIFPIKNGICGNNVLAQTRTNSYGEYTLNVKIRNGFYCLKATEGYYIEEYSTRQVSLTPRQMLYSIINYQAGNTININITPLTHIESALFSYYSQNYNNGRGTDNADALRLASSEISGILGFSSTSVTPLNITNGINTTTVITDSYKYGFYLAGISYFTGQVSKQMDNGKIHESLAYTSMQYAQIAYIDILSDGKLDGLKKEGNNNIPLSFGTTLLTPSIYRTGIAKAILAIANTPKNRTTLTTKNLLSFAQSISNNTSIVFNEIPPEPVDLLPPTIIINESIYTLVNKTITFNPIITDPMGLNSVKYFLNNERTPIYTAQDNNYSWNLDTTTLSNDEHQITIEAKDALNNTSSKTITFNVDNIAPTVTITSKDIYNKTDFNLDNHSINITGTYDTNNQDVKRILINGSPAIINRSNNTFTYAYDLIYNKNHSKSNGIKSYNLQTIDNLGNTSIVISKTFKVDTFSPEVSLKQLNALWSNPDSMTIFPEDIKIHSSMTSINQAQAVILSSKLNLGSITPSELFRKTKGTEYCTGLVRVNGNATCYPLHSQNIIYSYNNYRLKFTDVDTLRGLLTIEYKYLKNNVVKIDWTTLTTDSEGYNYLPISSEYFGDDFHLSNIGDEQQIKFRATDPAGNTKIITFTTDFITYVNPPTITSTYQINTNTFSNRYPVMDNQVIKGEFNFNNPIDSRIKFINSYPTSTVSQAVQVQHRENYQEKCLTATINFGGERSGVTNDVGGQCTQWGEETRIHSNHPTGNKTFTTSRRRYHSQSGICGFISIGCYKAHYTYWTDRYTVNNRLKPGFPKIITSNKDIITSIPEENITIQVINRSTGLETHPNMDGYYFFPANNDITISKSIKIQPIKWYKNDDYVSSGNNYTKDWRLAKDVRISYNLDLRLDFQYYHPHSNHNTGTIISLGKLEIAEKNGPNT